MEKDARIKVLEHHRFEECGSDREKYQAGLNKKEQEIQKLTDKNLERELQNVSRQHNRQQSKTKRREEEI